MRVAIVHDWLTGLRGGEKCLLAFLEIYPQADIFTLIHVPGSSSNQIDQRVKKTSWLNKLPLVKNYYRALLPFFPDAISRFDFSNYDLVISLSHAAAKNIRVPKNCLHICYCFTPMRYIWDQAKYYLGWTRFILWPVILCLREWDKTSDQVRRVDHYVAISRFVAARIRCFYSRRADVIYPPVDCSWINMQDEPIRAKTATFLCAGALVPYKCIDLVVRAFAKLPYRLVVAGNGPMLKKLKSMASANVEFRTEVSNHQLEECFKNAWALIFPGIEDFGILPLECLAAGTPVIAQHRGALKETINGPTVDAKSSITLSSYNSKEVSTGLFFKAAKNAKQEAVVDALVAAIKVFANNQDQVETRDCRAQALKFSPQRFKMEWRKIEARVLRLDPNSPARMSESHA